MLLRKGNMSTTGVIDDDIDKLLELKKDTPQSSKSPGSGVKATATKRGLAYLTNTELNQLSDPATAESGSVYTSQINIFRQQKKTTERLVAKQKVLLNTEARHQPQSSEEPDIIADGAEANMSINFELPPTPPQVTKSRKKKPTKNARKIANLLRDLEREQLNYLKERAANNATNISIVELDDDDEGASREIALRIMARGQILRYTTTMNANFSTVFEGLAQIYETEVQRILLTFNDTIVRQSDTPQSIGLSITDTLEFGIVNDEAAVEMARIEAADTRNTLLLKVQCQNSRTKVEIRIKNTDRMSKLMEIYAHDTGRDLSKLTFRFDGEQIVPDDTPEQLELEEGFCIDATEHS